MSRKIVRKRSFRGMLLRSQSLFTTPYRVEEIAKKRNIKMAQVAIAWTLSKDGLLDYSFRMAPHLLQSVITAPVIGTTSLENLVDLIGILTVKKKAQS